MRVVRVEFSRTPHAEQLVALTILLRRQHEDSTTTGDDDGRLRAVLDDDDGDDVRALLVDPDCPVDGDRHR